MPVKLRLPSFFGVSWRAVGAALLIGAILHIVTAFVLARVGASAAHDRLARRLKVNEMHVLPPVNAKTQLLPFQAADMAYALCPYDASTGPVTFRATLAGLGWSLGLFTPRGDNYYLVLGQEGRRTEIAIMLVPAGEQFVPMPRDSPGSQSILQIPLSEPRGIAVLAGPIEGLSYRSRVEAELRRASCTLRTR